MTRTLRLHLIPVAAVALLLLALPAFAQEEEVETGPQPAELIITPTELELEVGDSLTLQAEVRDGEGNPMDRTVVFYSRRRRAVGVNPAGMVEAYRPGEHTLIAMVPKDPEDIDRRAEPAVMVEIPVTIPNPPVASVEVANLPGHLYAGTEIGLRPLVTDISGAVRNDVEVGWTTVDSSVASVDALGVLTLTGAGRTTLTVSAEEASSDRAIEVLANPVASITLSGAPDEPARTGDVVFFEAKVTDASGNEVPDYPVQFATFGIPADGIVAPGAIGQIDEEGAFVAERSGTHTVIVDGFTDSASATVAVVSRNVRKDVEVVGRGPVRDRRTSDLWVWGGHRRPGLCGHRDPQRRRARLFLGRHRSLGDLAHRHGSGGCPDGERREGFGRREVLRDQPGRRLAPEERSGDPRRQRPAKRHRGDRPLR